MGEESHIVSPSHDLCLTGSLKVTAEAHVVGTSQSQSTANPRQVKGMCGHVLPCGDHPSGSRSCEEEDDRGKQWLSTGEREGVQRLLLTLG